MLSVYYWSKILKKLRGPAIFGSRIGKGSKVEAGSAFVNSTMGCYSFCGYDCEISSTDIGDFCSIANYVAIGGGEHPIDWVCTSPVFYEGRDSVTKKFSNFPRPTPKRVIIGSDVWIGYRAILMQGIKIGHGAVIGAGTIVTRDVEPYSIVAGQPARHLRFRFEDELRAALLASQWWTRDEVTLAACAQDIRDPKKFLEALKQCA
jgi:acetyltransferase-like isoleucine patch superfamily enzyme